jgi:hypothetical protein
MRKFADLQFAELICRPSFSNNLIARRRFDSFLFDKKLKQPGPYLNLVQPSLHYSCNFEKVRIVLLSMQCRLSKKMSNCNM